MTNSIAAIEEDADRVDAGITGAVAAGGQENWIIGVAWTFLLQLIICLYIIIFI